MCAIATKDVVTCSNRLFVKGGMMVLATKYSSSKPSRAQGTLNGTITQVCDQITRFTSLVGVTFVDSASPLASQTDADGEGLLSLMSSLLAQLDDNQAFAFHIKRSERLKFHWYESTRCRLMAAKVTSVIARSIPNSYIASEQRT